VISGEPLEFEFEAMVNSDDASRLVIGITLQALGTPVGATTKFLPLAPPGRQQITARLRLPTDILAPGPYTLSMSVGAMGDRDGHAADDAVWDALAFDVAADPRGSWLARNWRPFFGWVMLDVEASLEKPAAAAESDRLSPAS
jgi:hypothetical protein